MAGKPSKWSTEVTINSMEEDDEWNKMAMDRETTRQHLSTTKSCLKKTRITKMLSTIKTVLGRFEDPNPRGKTFRRVR